MADKRKEKTNQAIALLKAKHRELLQSGETRHPQRSDFSEAEVVLIKEYLGPWPRALEAAGIKPSKEKSAQKGGGTATDV